MSLWKIWNTHPSTWQWTPCIHYPAMLSYSNAVHSSSSLIHSTSPNPNNWVIFKKISEVIPYPQIFWYASLKDKRTLCKKKKKAVTIILLSYPQIILFFFFQIVLNNIKQLVTVQIFLTFFFFFFFQLVSWVWFQTRPVYASVDLFIISFKI